jgi:RimJ/RimL family protein N-acetyltransferase
MIVREAKPSDISEILEIINQEEDERVFTYDDTSIVKSYVLDYMGEVIGTAVYYTQDSECYVGIILRKDHRGKGLGSFLLKESLRMFAHKSVLARINKYNFPSKRFFKKNGFKLLKYDGEDEIYIHENSKEIRR